jgi:holin-like protein
MLGMAILFGFNLLGIVVKELTQVPLPANVIGLIIFTASLYSGIIKLAWVEASAQFMTKHMMIFFIPFLVGTMTFFPYIGAHFFSMIVSLFASTFIVLAITGWITKRLSNNEDDQGEQQHDL